MNQKRRRARAACMDLLLMALAALLFVWALGMPLAAGEALTDEETALLAALQTGEIVRLHVLADGDDAESQRVKLAVRDAILSAFGETLARGGAQSADAAYAALRQNVAEIRAAAESCARQNGFAGEVRAEVGTLPLPAKRYGAVTLPEGEYRALRVTLGSGEGKNWWCVLFPRLCLAAAGAETDVPPAPVWLAPRILKCWTALAF